MYLVPFLFLKAAQTWHFVAGYFLLPYHTFVYFDKNIRGLFKKDGEFLFF